MNIPDHSALILVDIQHDFLPGGALATQNGDAIVSIVNKLMGYFELIIATQDWHPANHKSFAVHHPGKKEGDRIDLNGLEQILWPIHCVQGSKGARFSDELHSKTIDRVFRKGTDPETDSYSGFFDNGHRKSTGLGDFLQDKGIQHVFIAGLATDYCVKFTALDAVELDFETYVIKDACRGVDLNPGDVDQAITDMKEKGINIIQSTELE